MTERQTIIDRNPLVDYLHARGLELKRAGSKLMCCCPLHEDRTPSFSVDPEKGLWNCFGGCGGGSVIDLHAALTGMTIGEAMRDLAGEEPTQPPPPLRQDARQGQSSPKPREVCHYDYQDATGRVVYQVVRYEPKTFRQRQVMPDGSFNWSMDGVERILYRLPEILAGAGSKNPDVIFICEGEKDVETLRRIGFVATCNAGGAKKWLPSYSEYLRGRRVYLVPDNDEPGQDHARTVLKSLEGVVESANWIDLPREVAGKPIKDISDFAACFEDKTKFFDAIVDLEKNSRLIDRGVDVDIYSMAEMESRYAQDLRRHSEISLDLRHWLPSLNVRPLIPGDLLGIIAGTGQMKSAAAQNIVSHNGGLATLFFQMEITETLMFERSAAIATGLNAEEIYMKYARGEAVNWKRSRKFNNLLVCPRSGLTMEDVDQLIARSSAKFGKVPNVFVLDYIQLIRGKGSRYDRVSDAAEQAKVLAKKWNCIGVVISQIGRKKKEQGDESEIQEVSLFDGKESGSLENSCGVMLGLWKTSKTEMKCRVLKNTKGTAGSEANIEIQGGTFIMNPSASYAKYSTAEK